MANFLSKIFRDKTQDISVRLEAKHRSDRLEELIQQTGEYQSSISYFGWEIKGILSALESYEAGTFASAESLYTAMIKNPRIAGALATIAHSVRMMPIRFTSPDGTPSFIKKRNESYEHNFDMVIRPEDQTEITQRVAVFGFCFGIVNLIAVDDLILPSIEPMRHYNISYDFQRQCYRTMIKDASGSFKYVYINPADPRFVMFSLGGQQPWLRGAFRPLAEIFQRLTNATDQWARYNDTEAGALRIVYTPSLQRENQSVRELVKKIATMRVGDTALAPDGYDYKLLTSQGRGSAYHSFRDMIAKCDADIAIVLLGHNLSQEVKGGSLAAAESAGGVTKDRIIGLASALDGPINERITPIYMQQNFTPSLYKDLVGSIECYAPKVEHYFDDIKDPLAMAQAAKASAESLEKFIQISSQAGVNLAALGIDWVEQARKCGISLQK